MDLRQIEYIIKIADEHSITRAAEQLYISQSGLNQQLLKLEKELGLPLFHRSKHDIQLTEAGKIYVESGRKIIQLKKETYNKIYDIANNNAGTLRIGLTPERGTTMLLNIYPEFHKAFPGVTIEPSEIHVKKQLTMLAKDNLDLGFSTLTDIDKTPSITFHHVKYENILLGIPRSHPLAAHANPPYKPYATIDLSLFQNDTFVLMFKDSTLRNVIDPLFQKAGFTPRVLFETSSNRTLYTMAKTNMGCTLIPETYALEQEEVAYFLLPEAPKWEMAITYHKGHYLSRPTEYMINLIQNYWNQ
ncbi:LysR substrate-binding domain-containing protein [Lacrimispora sp. JR3]|uniref:LysR substrate-binding domain-containing protein n=1 Tax=Lacrimispora sinapis TaxID=3111456 RepID=UPI00374860F9